MCAGMVNDLHQTVTASGNSSFTENLSSNGTGGLTAADSCIRARVKQHRSAWIQSLTRETFLTKFPVCRRTLRNYELAGKIPVIRLGRKKFYHWGNFQAALTRLQRNCEGMGA